MARLSLWLELLLTTRYFALYQSFLDEEYQEDGSCLPTSAEAKARDLFRVLQMQMQMQLQLQL